MSTKAGKVRTIMIAAACALLLAGCGVNKAANDTGGSAVSPTPTSSEPAESPVPTVSPTDAPKLSEQEVSVYLSDEHLENMIERKVKIEYDGSELELIKKSLEALQENQEPNVSLWQGITMNSVDFEEGLVTIDLQIPDESRLGAPGEMMLIDSLKQTLFQFPNVDSIQLLVDGAQLESLMGHVELDHPLRKEE